MNYLTNRIIRLALIVCSLVFCTNNYACNRKKTKQHKIVDIERIGDTFIIHTEKNDTIYHVISTAFGPYGECDYNTNKKKYTQLIIGNYYDLNLVLDEVIFATFIEKRFGIGYTFGGPRVVSSATNDFGKSVAISEYERYHRATNVCGLYFVSKLATRNKKDSENGIMNQ